MDVVGINIDVLSITVSDSEPPRKDPTGGVRATNETGELTVVKLNVFGIRKLVRLLVFLSVYFEHKKEKVIKLVLDL